jgi:hypothetical protein
MRWARRILGQRDNDVISLQIVESSQVDLNNKKQAKMLANATHFELVCSTLNYKQERFDLTKYVDLMQAL